MPFRPRFDCLWCGRAWEARSSDDLEGWAALCPDCLGKADDNGFLRMRLRTALRERSAAAAAAYTTAPGVPPAHDDWYLRSGRFSRGPLYDGPWLMELDEVTRWLDAVPLGGRIVELGCGSGWWSTLLAGRGELWLYDADGPSLDAARRRLVAHGLLAHLHQRDPLAAPEQVVDAVFAAYLLGAAEDLAGLRARLQVVKAWLKPGGTFVFLEAGSAAGHAPIDGPAGPLWPRDAETLRGALADAGLEVAEVAETAGSLVFGRATLPA